MSLFLKRLSILLFSPLLLGLIINQFHSEGIQWSLLSPANNSGQTIEVTMASTDSAFIWFMEESAVFLDVRSEEAFSADHIPGALSFSLPSYYKTPGIINNLDSNKQYVIYCFDPDCQAAEILAEALIANSFRNVAILYGGLSEWLENGYPTEQ